jgi:hypothetical protein
MIDINKLLRQLQAQAPANWPVIQAAPPQSPPIQMAPIPEDPREDETQDNNNATPRPS